jgi:DNA-directed RNA polymerase II subunit RPB7
MNFSAEKLIELYSEDAQLESAVVILPHLLRYNLTHVVQDRLTRQIQGRCTLADGFIIKMRHIVDIRGGSLEQRTGAVNYTVDFVASCLRPEVGDTVHAIVSRVMKIGIFADLGPLSIFIPQTYMPQGFEFQSGEFVRGRREIKQQSVITVTIQQIEMLDDNYLPTKTTSCVMKAMGVLCDEEDEDTE